MKYKAPKKSYADRRLGNPTPVAPSSPALQRERIVGCALRNGTGTHYTKETADGSEAYYHSHTELRRMLGYERPYTPDPKDTHLFVTSEKRIVPRLEASYIAAAAGQCSDRLAGTNILSSDIRL